jgi:hypothetical protein
MKFGNLGILFWKRLNLGKGANVGQWLNLSNLGKMEFEKVGYCYIGKVGRWMKLSESGKMQPEKVGFKKVWELDDMWVREEDKSFWEIQS